MRRRLRGRTGGRFGRSPVQQSAASARPPLRVATRPIVDELPFTPRAFIFDVEGTLVDTALATLQCWSETLAEIGHPASVADLHPFCGMDGKRMLRRLLNRHEPKLLDHIVKLQSERYRQRYLPHIRPFPGLRRLFAGIKEAGGKIALATTCDKDELAHYRSLMNIDDLIEAACCGEDVRREKPSPDVVGLAVKKLRLAPEGTAMVGDTPYDAQAARAAGLLPIGLQSGYFSRSDLSDAGCAAVFFDLRALGQKLEERRPPAQTAENAEAVKSHTAAAADSH